MEWIKKTPRCLDHYKDEGKHAILIYWPDDTCGFFTMFDLIYLDGEEWSNVYFFTRSDHDIYDFFTHYKLIDVPAKDK